MNNSITTVSFRVYRHIAYRRFVLWIWHRLGRGNRKIIPACVVTKIRSVFPSEQYTGFRYPRPTWSLSCKPAPSCCNELVFVIRLPFWGQRWWLVPQESICILACGLVWRELPPPFNKIDAQDVDVFYNNIRISDLFKISHVYIRTVIVFCVMHFKISIEYTLVIWYLFNK